MRKLRYKMKSQLNLHKYKNCIIASAHQSMFETFVFNYLVPDAFFVIKKENFKSNKLISIMKKKRIYVPQRYQICHENTKSFINYFFLW